MTLCSTWDQNMPKSLTDPFRNERFTLPGLLGAFFPAWSRLCGPEGGLQRPLTPGAAVSLPRKTRLPPPAPKALMPPMVGTIANEARNAFGVCALISNMAKFFWP
jgi:hypothetical protein